MKRKHLFVFFVSTGNRVDTSILLFTEKSKQKHFFFISFRTPCIRKKWSSFLFEIFVENKKHGVFSNNSFFLKDENFREINNWRELKTPFHRFSVRRRAGSTRFDGQDAFPQDQIEEEKRKNLPDEFFLS